MRINSGAEALKRLEGIQKHMEAHAGSVSPSDVEGLVQVVEFLCHEVSGHSHEAVVAGVSTAVGPAEVPVPEPRWVDREGTPSDRPGRAAARTRKGK